MIKNDVNLSVATNILNQKITKLNIEIVENPSDSKLQAELEELLNVKKEIEKGNILLIQKVINDAKNEQ